MKIKEQARQKDILQVGNLVEGAQWNNPHRGRVYSPWGIAPCIDACGGGQREKKILIEYGDTIKF